LSGEGQLLGCEPACWWEPACWRSGEAGRSSLRRTCSRRNPASGWESTCRMGARLSVGASLLAIRRQPADPRCGGPASEGVRLPGGSRLVGWEPACRWEPACWRSGDSRQIPVAEGWFRRSPASGWESTCRMGARLSGGSQPAGDPATAGRLATYPICLDPSAHTAAYPRTLGYHGKVFPPPQRPSSVPMSARHARAEHPWTSSTTS